MPSGATTVRGRPVRPSKAAMPQPVCARSTAGGPAVEAIQRRGRLIVGVDQSTNLFSFRDPVSGELQGFDIDMPERWPATSSAIRQGGVPPADIAERISALQDGTVDIVAKALTITCARASRSRSLPCTSRRANGCWYRRIHRCRDRPTWPACGSCQGWTPHRWRPLTGRANGNPCRVQNGRLPGRAFSRVRRRGQHRRHDPGRHAVQDPNLHIVGPAGGRTVRYRINKSQDDFGTRGQCQPGTDPSDADVVAAVPEVAHRARPGGESARPKYRD